MTFRLCAAILALAALPSLAAAQNPLSNKKFVAGLIATNPMNVASVRLDATAGDARYAIAINYGLIAHQVVVTTGKTKTEMTLSDGVAWRVQNGGRPQAMPAEAKDLERGIWMTPAGVYKAAQMPDAKATIADVPGPGGKTYMAVTYTAAGARLKATLTDQGLVEKVETVGDDGSPTNAVAVTYADYKDVDGIKFPMRMTESRDGQVVRDLTVTGIRPNAGFYAEPPAKLEPPKP